MAGLGWSPADFWQATPQELAAACLFLEAGQGGVTPDDFKQLKAALEVGQWNLNS